MKEGHRHTEVILHKGAVKKAARLTRLCDGSSHGTGVLIWACVSARHGTALILGCLENTSQPG